MKSQIRRILDRLDQGRPTHHTLVELTAETENLKRQVQKLEATTHADMVAIQELRRELLMLFSHMSLPPSEDWESGPPLHAGFPSQSAFPNSTICRETSFREPYFSFWAKRMKQEIVYHRKLWEFIFICQALYERNFLVPGSKGLGFGVGGEPLAALFASYGCKVTATDMESEAAHAAGWTETQQHASGRAPLNQAKICEESLFRDNVQFRVVDMNAVPADLQGFDFCWSACALEHLGSIDQGLEFILKSLGTLRPGGVAVHTTEYNLSSNDMTLDEGGTVLFRQRDFEDLQSRLRRLGHELAPLDLTPGAGRIERYIDVPPYRHQPHLRLALAGYATTSVGIVAIRGDI